VLCSKCYKKVSRGQGVYKIYNFFGTKNLKGGIFCKKCAIEKEKELSN
jgi:hypothetical protein